MVDQEKVSAPAASPTPGREANPAAQEEEHLWNLLLESPDSEDAHNAYFRHILKNGLTKEAMRRYGPVVEDKDRFSVESRRLFRRHQQTLVNMMFMATPRPQGSQNRNNILLGSMFVSTVLIIAGFMLPGYAKVVSLFGVGGLIFLGWRVFAGINAKPKGIPGPGSGDTLNP